MSARAYIAKLIRVRIYLMETGKSGWKDSEVQKAIDRVRKWLETHPRANDAQVAAYLRRQLNDVMMIMPGQKCPAHNKLNQELNSIIYENAH